MSITLRTALLSWLVTIVTLLIFIGVIIPEQKRTYLENLESKAHGVTISLKDVAAGAVVNEDYSIVVEHCTQMLAGDKSISYLVITKNDGLSLIHERAGWRNEALPEEWRPARRVSEGGIRFVPLFKHRVFHYAQPFDYSGIQWGWIHVGLSLESYDRSIATVYRRTSVIALVCILLSLAASIVYAKRLVQPILSLQTVVRQVAGGDLSARATIKSGDEVENLANSVNTMTESLLRRDRIMQSVHFAAQQFLSVQDWHAVIDEILANIGQAAQASQLTIFENVADENGVVISRRSYEWFLEPDMGMRPKPAAYTVSPPDKCVERLVSMMEQGKIVITHLSQSSGAERAMLEEFQVKSALFMPITVSGQWWGQLVECDHRKEQDWSEAEIIFLQAAANTLGSAIERQQAKEALVQAKEAAESASQAKSQFLANMSHEIRTPITGVMGMLELLKRTELNKKQIHFLNNALASADTLLAIVGDVLDFSKIEAGKLELEEVPLKVRDIMDSATRLFASKAEEKGLELAYCVDRTVPQDLSGDSTRLQQILVNLLSNAMKFSAAGEIAMNCTLVESSSEWAMLRFEVRDAGCGIARDKQKLIFEAFSQADNSMARIHGGTGLGLTICRQLCTSMGGQIGVESELGQGSTFWFTVRLKMIASQESGALKPLKDLKNLSVLIVDDSAVVCEFVRDCILNWQGKPTVAAEAGHALVQLRNAAQSGHPYAVAVLDWKMPEMDGLALARIIKEDELLREMPLILMSSFANAEEIGHGARFAAYVPKPVSSSDLYDAMTNAINGPRKRMESAVLLPSSPAAGPLPGRPGFTVLVAEDNGINQEVATEMLDALGYRYQCVGTGREALAAVQMGGVDLVLMDCQMPEMDGYEATTKIRAWENGIGQPGRRRLPIVALTAHAMSGDKKRCLEAGMDDYLAKPLDPEVLARLLRRWLNGKEQGEASAAGGDAPASRPLAMSPGFDYPSLLRRCMGKTDLVKRLVSKFKQQAQADLPELEIAIQQGNVARVTLVAHRLKGAAANVSVESLRQTAAAIEALGRSGSLAGTAELKRRLDLEFRALVGEVLEEESL